MLKNLKPSEVQLIAFIVGLALIYCSFTFGFKKISAKTDVLRQENATLQSRKDELEQKRAHIAEYEAQAEEDTLQGRKILDTMPEKITMERSIKYTLDTMEKCSINVSSISIGGTTAVYTFTNVDGSTENTPIVSATNVTCNYSGSYNAIKEAVKELNSGDTRIRIDDISASYDTSTGSLSGTAALSVFTVSGGVGRAYEEPDFDVNVGKDNIFGSVTDNAQLTQ
jgi:hypothetical protein